METSIQNQQEKEHSVHLLPLLPLKNVVILPKSIIPVIVGRQASIAAVEHALRADKMVFITAQKRPDTENPALDDLYRMGTRSTILQVMRTPQGSLKILVEGLCRARADRLDVINETDQEQVKEALVFDIPTTHLDRSVELEAAWRQLKGLYHSYAKMNEKMPSDLLAMVKSTDDMDHAIDTIVVHLDLSFDERQKVLELADLIERMIYIAGLLERETEIFQTEVRVRGRIQTQIEKGQREYYLSEQMKAIQKELGRDEQSQEVAQLRLKAKTLGLTPDALEKTEKELRRLEQMPPLSSEAVVSRHYIDWIMSIPWKKTSKDRVSLSRAGTILSESHAGLDKPKERILEFLAAKKFAGIQEKSPIICLVGPPGVGKTSLAQAIAQALGRSFIRISLGGVRDEAEIRGHRRTYIGALPGKIIHAIKRAGTINPVILLDEIDKLARDAHGDPAAALLEVLDPEQNKTFVDHFLDTEFDLSKTMFITTANTIDGIPYPLLDRMDLIQLAGYSEDEKKIIAQKFLIPKKRAEYHLTPKQFILEPAALNLVLTEYTKEAGVRQLERVIAKLMRKVIQELLTHKDRTSVTVTPELCKEWLGYARFKKSPLDTQPDRIGIATGLAWTEVGGDVLEIEASVVPGKGQLTLTGQMGEVMQESAQAALSYIRARTKELGLKKFSFATKDIHIHIPEGATPKDGPSAGITMCLALVSALTKRPINRGIALTGEITLRGRVLPVGGLKEKLLAALRYSITTVIVPHENSDDILDALKEAPSLKELKIIYVDHMDQVLTHALGS